MSLNSLARARRESESCSGIIGTRMLTIAALSVTLSATAWANTIGSDHVVLSYHEDAVAGMILDTVGDLGEPSAHFLAWNDLWEIELRRTDGTVVTIRPSAATFNFALIETPMSFTAIWSNVTSPALSGECFNVMVFANAPMGDRVIEFEIEVTTATPTHALYAVRFPRIEVFPRGEPGSDILTYPYAGGWLLPNPANNPLVQIATGIPQIQPGPMSMQWLAFYDSAEIDGSVLFTGSRDGTGHHKGYTIGADAVFQTWSFEVRQVPEDNLTPDGDYVSPYPCVLGVVRGDWYDAARFYRRWAQTQPFADNGPMRDRADFSEFIRNGKMFAVSNLYDSNQPEDYQYWARDIRHQREYFDVDAIPTHIYGWHDNAFDVDWGEWWPIKPEFAQYAPEVAAQGDVFAPYIHNMVYNQNVPSYSNPYVPGYENNTIRDFALIDENGNAVTTTDSLGQPVDALCMATQFCNDYTIYSAERLFNEAFAQGLYLDVFPFESAQTCYSHNHGHPVGGGDYYTQAKIQLVQDLRDYMRAAYEPEYFVYSEAQCEPYVGIVELVYHHNAGDTYDDPNDDPDFGPLQIIAPLFEAVYHDYQIVGTVAPIHSQELYPDSVYQLIRRIYAANIFFGHSPWAGTMMGELSLHDQIAASAGYEKLADMVYRFMNTLKLDPARDFVTFGERRRDPATDSLVISLLPGDNFLPYGTEQPLVYASAYGRPGYHGFGVLLLNWTAEGDEYIEDIPGGPQTVSWNLRPEDFDNLTDGCYGVTEFRVDGVVTQDALYSIPEIFSGTVSLPERSAVFVRILLAGDVTGDGRVCLDDLAQLLAHYGQTSGASWADGDMNADGRVLLDDLALLLSAYGVGGCD